MTIDPSSDAHCEHKRKLGFEPLGKNVGHQWKILKTQDPKRLAYYEQKATVDRDRYTAELAIWNEQNDQGRAPKTTKKIAHSNHRILDCFTGDSRSRAVPGNLSPEIVPNKGSKSKIKAKGNPKQFAFVGDQSNSPGQMISQPAKQDCPSDNRKRPANSDPRNEDSPSKSKARGNPKQFAFVDDQSRSAGRMMIQPARQDCYIDDRKRPANPDHLPPGNLHNEDSPSKSKSKGNAKQFAFVDDQPRSPGRVTIQPAQQSLPYKIEASAVSPIADMQGHLKHSKMLLLTPSELSQVDLNHSRAALNVQSHRGCHHGLLSNNPSQAGCWHPDAQIGPSPSHYSTGTTDGVVRQHQQSETKSFRALLSQSLLEPLPLSPPSTSPYKSSNHHNFYLTDSDIPMQHYHPPQYSNTATSTSTVDRLISALDGEGCAMIVRRFSVEP